MRKILLSVILLVSAQAFCQTIEKEREVLNQALKDGTLTSSEVLALLVLMPKKTRRQRKVVKIPLSVLAKQLIDEGGGTGEYLFAPLADATANVRLKEIALAAGINKRLTTHVGRHTFGFLYLLMGGKVEELREIMGHSKMETTQIYTHTDHDRKVAGVKRFDEIFKPV